MHDSKDAAPNGKAVDTGNPDAYGGSCAGQIARVTSALGPSRYYCLNYVPTPPTLSLPAASWIIDSIGHAVVSRVCRPQCLALFIVAGGSRFETLFSHASAPPSLYSSASTLSHPQSI